MSDYDLPSEPIVSDSLRDLPVNVAVLDRSGCIIQVNQDWHAFARANGYDGEDHGLGCNYLELCDGARGPQAQGAGAVAEGVRRVLAGILGCFITEYRCDAPTEQRWFRLVVLPNPQGDGGVVVSHMDITPMEAAKGAIDSDDANFRGLVESAIEGVLVHRYDELLFANQAFAEMLGYQSPEEILALGSADAWLSEQERARIRGYASERLAGQRPPRHYECRAIRKGGGQVWLESRSVKIEWRGSTAILGLFNDITDHHLARERTEAIVRANPIPSAITRLSDGIIEYANEQFRQLFKISGEMVGRRAADLYVDQVARDRMLARLKEAGEIHGEEHKVRATNGKEIWVVISGKLIDYGDEVAAFGTLYDISERKRAEAELQRSETSLADAQNVAKVGSWSRDIETGTLAWSAQEFRLYGFEPNEVVPTPELVRAAIHPDDRERFAADRKAAFKGPGLPGRQTAAFASDYRVLLPDDSETWIHQVASMVWDEDGQPARFFGTDQDITERKRGEIARQESEARFRDFAEIASDWFWETDEQHSFIYQSQNNLKYFGEGWRHVIGRTRFEMRHPDDHDDAHWAAHRAVIEAHRPFQNFVYPVVAAEGVTRFAKISGVPKFNAKGEFAGYRVSVIE